MIDVIKDTLFDGIKLIPFLFIAFLIIELVEHKLSTNSKKIISKSGKIGPLFGSVLGLFPQCGFSVMATNLYVTRIITLGTLISAYLSTSDEMLPILLSENVNVITIIEILAIKVFIGMGAGFIIDLCLRKRENKAKLDYHICDDEHCDCKHGILLSTIKHTVNTLIFIVLITFILNVILAYFGMDYVSKIFMKNSIFAPFITSLVGLIPNCGASVMISELYIHGAISFSSLIGGLLTGSGVAILVLLKENKNIRENLLIISLIYFIGAISGVVIGLIGMII